MRNSLNIGLLVIRKIGVLIKNIQTRLHYVQYGWKAIWWSGCDRCIGKCWVCLSVNNCFGHNGRQLALDDNFWKWRWHFVSSSKSSEGEGFWSQGFIGCRCLYQWVWSCVLLVNMESVSRLNGINQILKDQRVLEQPYGMLWWKSIKV